MPLNDDNSSDYFGNVSPKCPYCDEHIDVNECEFWELYEEETQEIDCPHCDKTISVTPSASWSFDTSEQEKL
jgi:hypothetical protein